MKRSSNKYIVAVCLMLSASAAFDIARRHLHPLARYGAAAQSTGDVSATKVQQSEQRLDAAVQVQHSHTSAAVLSLTPPGDGYIYITGLDVSNCEGATTVAVANPTYITTAGINGSPQYQVGSGPGTSPGVCSPVSGINFATPLRSQTAGTVVTFTLPTFIANQTISLNVYYRAAK